MDNYNSRQSVIPGASNQLLVWLILHVVSFLGLGLESMKFIDSRHPGDHQCRIRTIKSIRMLFLLQLADNFFIQHSYVDHLVGCLGYWCVQRPCKRQLSALTVVNGHISSLRQFALVKQHG